MASEESGLHKTMTVSIDALKTIARVDDRPRRTQVLIDPGFQLAFAVVLLAVAAISGVVGAIGFQGIVDLAGEAEARAARLDALSAASGDLAGLCLMVVVVAILLSHRVCGPIFCARGSMEKVGKGAKGVKMKLRPGDQFRQLETAFNEMTSGLEDLDFESQRWLKNLRKSLKGVADRLRTADEAELPEVLLRLEELDERVDRRLGGLEAALQAPRQDEEP